MKVRREMKIEEVLAMNEEKVLNTLMMLSTNFERLRHPKLRRALFISILSSATNPPKVRK